MAEKGRVVAVRIELKGSQVPRLVLTRRANSRLKANSTVKANARRVIIVRS